MVADFSSAQQTGQMIVPTTEPQPTLAPQPTATPAPTPAPTVEPVPTATPAPTAMPTEAPAPTEAPKTSYTVKKGDTLLEISIREYGTKSKVSAICELNKIKDPDNIKVGQKILLP